MSSKEGVVVDYLEGDGSHETKIEDGGKLVSLGVVGEGLEVGDGTGINYFDKDEPSRVKCVKVSGGTTVKARRAIINEAVEIPPLSKAVVPLFPLCVAFEVYNAHAIGEPSNLAFYFMKEIVEKSDFLSFRPGYLRELGLSTRKCSQAKAWYLTSQLEEERVAHRKKRRINILQSVLQIFQKVFYVGQSIDNTVTINRLLALYEILASSYLDLVYVLPGCFVKGKLGSFYCLEDPKTRTFRPYATINANLVVGWMQQIYSGDKDHPWNSSLRKDHVRQSLFDYCVHPVLKAIAKTNETADIVEKGERTWLEKKVISLL